MKKEIICIICPRGCHITVTGEGQNIQSIEGAMCKRGKEYATSEFTNPVRILTTTVKINDRKDDLLPVRSKDPISKDKLFECMEIIRKTTVNSPVKCHDVVINDICGTGVDIVATKDIY
ncbi:MAG TPA: DUF1667 domain-containing protein [Clostridiaceae bacterium]|jgi:CxxC motif-containing protein|nr:DUF1667 domain-containing protein [Clostridiaceae bacterium]